MLMRLGLVGWLYPRRPMRMAVLDCGQDRMRGKERERKTFAATVVLVAREEDNNHSNSCSGNKQ